VKEWPNTLLAWNWKEAKRSGLEIVVGLSLHLGQGMQVTWKMGVGGKTCHAVF
jgi:hypothetical protein